MTVTLIARQRPCGTGGRLSIAGQLRDQSGVGNVLSAAWIRGPGDLTAFAGLLPDLTDPDVMREAWS